MSESENFSVNSHAREKVYRVLELYSGIGGMRYALEAAGMMFKLVAAVDINPVVNEIYCHNFGKDDHLQRNIQSLTASDIENMNVDLITMSPPCQPFTRNGLKRDTEDNRTNSFMHILQVLTDLKQKPSFITIENVKGFEDSQMRDLLIETLTRCGYIFQEYLLSPSDFGVPNSRLRYYLLAKLKKLDFFFPTENKIQLKLPVQAPRDFFSFHCLKCSLEKSEQNKQCCIQHFLEEESSEYFNDYLISDNMLLKYWSVLDIVNGKSYNSCCFTKAYSHYAQGTGSVFTPFEEPHLTETFQKISCIEDNNEKLNLLKSLSLRYFTPKEVANIMCFPNKFEFPGNLTTKQKLKALGNSLNVFVVACLFKLLFQSQNVVL